MRKLLILFLIFPLLLSCNDGDVIVENFNFDHANLQTCGDVGSYVFFKENTESFESLSLHLGVSDSIYNEPALKTYNLNNSSTYVHYRRHDGPLGNNYFCTNVLLSSPNVLEEYKAVSGSAQVIVTFEYETGDRPTSKSNLNSRPNQNSSRPWSETLHKNVQIILKDLVLIKGNEQIIIETLDMGTIEDIEVIEL